MHSIEINHNRGGRFLRTAGLCLLVWASMVTVTSARADGGLYVGAGGGGAKYNGFNEFCRKAIEDLAGTGIESDCDTDETVFGWKLFGGWRFNPYFAVEGGWVNLGEAEDTTEVAGEQVRAKISVDGWFAEIVGSVPVGDNARILGKLGAAALDLTLEARAGGLGIGGSLSDDSTDIVYGAGFEYAFTPGFLGRLEWERFDVEDAVDLFSASVVFQFGI